MPFSELIGHQRAIDTLRGALRRGSLHHAYLFAGPEGVGKGLAARLLAQAANCEGDIAEPRSAPLPGIASTTGALPDDPCGECTPCKKILREVHPDVLLFSEERTMAKAGRWEPKGGKTPSKDIVVDQIRELVDHRLALKRSEGRRRFVIIDPADAMNVQAQNALLKTLEEPPSDTTLVLVASQADSLLPTIRSRCLRIAFTPMPQELIEERLCAEGRDPLKARLAAALSCGSLGKALVLKSEALDELKRAVEEIAALGPDDAGRWIAYAKAWGADRDAARETCELIRVWLRDVLAWTAAGADAPLALVDLAEATEQLASRLSPEELFRRIQRVSQALVALSHNGAPALALERMLIGWFHG